MKGPPFEYPKTPPLTNLRLFDSCEFYTTGINNFWRIICKTDF